MVAACVAGSHKQYCRAGIWIQISLLKTMFGELYLYFLYARFHGAFIFLEEFKKVDELLQSLSLPYSSEWKNKVQRESSDWDAKCVDRARLVIGTMMEYQESHQEALSFVRLFVDVFVCRVDDAVNEYNIEQLCIRFDDQTNERCAVRQTIGTSSDRYVRTISRYRTRVGVCAAFLIDQA